MARDGSGNYTLPAGNPVVDDTIIDALWANATMADIAVQLNNVFTRDGILGPLAAFKFVDGTDASPGATFANQLGTGLWNSTLSSGYSFRGVSHFTSSASLLTVNVPTALASTLVVTGAIAASGGLVGNVTGRLLGTNSSDTYIPTFGSLVGCSTVDETGSFYWTRIGNIVTVHGLVSVATSAASAASMRSFTVSFPPTVTPAGSPNAKGHGSLTSDSSVTVMPMFVSYSGGAVVCEFLAPASESINGSFSFVFEAA